MFEIGRGVAQSETEAAQWYKKAAEKGLPEAQNNLGLMLAKGHGVRGGAMVENGS
jgi:TPR repeat protein